MREDALSLIALLIVFVHLMVTPGLGRRIATTAVSNYALTEGSARLILERNDISLLESSGGLTKGRESI